MDLFLTANAPLLFILAFPPERPFPTGFSINTIRAPLGPGEHVRRVYASIFSTYPRHNKWSVAYSVFVEGPRSDTTEGALRNLLEKVETLIRKHYWPLGRERNWPTNINKRDLVTA